MASFEGGSYSSFREYLATSGKIGQVRLFAGGEPV